MAGLAAQELSRVNQRGLVALGGQQALAVCQCELLVQVFIIQVQPQHCILVLLMECQLGTTNVAPKCAPINKAWGTRPLTSTLTKCRLKVQTNELSGPAAHC